MKKIVLVMLSAMLLVGCGQSYEEAKEQSARERAMQQKKEAEALKVGVLPPRLTCGLKTSSRT